ncbi:MAG: MFS transporter [Anaerolineaceae bacterium]|nr:MFS transporter [Anaerolineaceae bacterium]
MNANKPQSSLWTPDFIRLNIFEVFTYNALTVITGTFSMYAVEKFSASPVQISVISSLLIIASLIFRPVVGFLIDRYGRRITLYIGLAISAVLSMLFLFPKTIFQLGLLRFLMGFPFAMVTTGNSVLRSDIIPEERRTDGFSITSISMMFSALVTGPNLGYWMLKISNFNVLLLLSTTLYLIALFIFSTMKFEDIKDISTKFSFTFNEMFEPRALWLALVLGLNFTGWPGILTFGPLYAQEIGLNFIGFLFLAYGVGLVISRPIIKLLERDGIPFYTNAVGVSSILIGHTVIGFFPSSVGFLTGMAFLGAGFGLCFTILQKLAFDLVEPERRGRCSATIYFSQNLGSTMGRFIFGFSAQSFGTYIYSYRIMAAIALLPLLLLLFVALPNYTRKMKET